MEKCKISILGSTGSIGQSTLKVISQYPAHYEVFALSAHTNYEKLFEQCCIFKPRYAVMTDTYAAAQLENLLKMQGLPIKVLQKESGLSYIAQHETVAKVVCAIVGAAGLLSTLSAVEAGKQVLIANKESLVMAGDFLLAIAKKTGAILLPIDSEHNALFQCMPPQYIVGSRPEGVHKIILTASGGPFLSMSKSMLENVTPAMACQHPTWKMGKKITIDCATLMNKGLEIIEASKLFQFDASEIAVVIHPQSIIHSLVEYVDGSHLAQLGAPDMCVPISYCLSWPNRHACGAKPLSLTKIGQLTFMEPDTDRFACLNLAYEALKLKNASTAVLNASNEVAVQAFVDGQISFVQIATIVDKVLQKYCHLPANTLPEILHADSVARKHAIALTHFSKQLVNL
ncbi:MAG: 1-deoxy-D-xylulose-5-phosphate reductoisomerase [Proteobacteria bacterium]|nr:1-deoxy-D-xylulose-5-phosphate reductoisomerase [Pseudomonadota bacterium]